MSSPTSRRSFLKTLVAAPLAAKGLPAVLAASSSFDSAWVEAPYSCVFVFNGFRYVLSEPLRVDDSFLFKPPTS